MKTVILFVIKYVLVNESGEEENRAKDVYYDSLWDVASLIHMLDDVTTGKIKDMQISVYPQNVEEDSELKDELNCANERIEELESKLEDVSSYIATLQGSISNAIDSLDDAMSNLENAQCDAEEIDSISYNV